MVRDIPKPYCSFLLHFSFSFYSMSIECLVEARQLHDMLRRIDTYKTAFGEPVVTDHKTAEQWYSLGQYRLAGATPDLKPGSCGSPFPIVLSGN